MALRPSPAIANRHDVSSLRSSSVTPSGYSSSVGIVVSFHLHEKASKFNDREPIHCSKLKAQHSIASPRWHISAALPQGVSGDGVSRLTCPSALDNDREPPSAATTDPLTSEGWDCARSAALYRIEGWSGGYFSVNDQGHVIACVDGDSQGEETSTILKMTG